MNRATSANGSILNPIVTVILVLAALYVAHSVFIPLTFALFVIALVWPLQAALQKRMPKLLALFITLAITIFVVLTVSSAVLWGLSRLVQWLIANAGHYQAVFNEWSQWLDEQGIAVAGPLTELFNVRWLSGFLQTLMKQFNSMAGFLTLVFVFVMLGLLEVDDFNERLRLPSVQPMGATMLRANRMIGTKLRRFMVVRSFASVLTGLFVWSFSLLAGLELAAAWGAIAFALNYIPFLGPLIATIFPTLFAIVQFESWQTAVTVFLCLNAIQFITGSYIEPRVTGSTLTISPFAVVFVVFFFSFLWGLQGAFIGVPILIAVVVYCAQFPSTRWLAVLAAGGGAQADPPPES
ncbi:AI-2E family transporter [Aquamicrobium sp. NLF2-7]|uniref:AI-2E family transporter n=1 Tax=Aquamicrobium sp. NLF2-7 TaxID=2918753 RepID=UPI001EFC10BA|nr:AI-2E family transporter [Aquamicrobium sp. NLF2-7]MCG8274468.1 AI-2E family transporter [Aquamicrobium sp. NLF2-7]